MKNVLIITFAFLLIAACKDKAEKTEDNEVKQIAEAMKG